MFKKFEIFKTGTHTDASGNTRDWTEADLDKIAANYNAEVHEAPIVVGHPKDNSPAFGWIEKVFREGDTLFAAAKDVINEFADAVQQGLYKKRSISLYPDGTLRHVGFLGGMPPAVKGLKDLNFNEDGEPLTTIEFGEEEIPAVPETPETPEPTPDPEPNPEIEALKAENAKLQNKIDELSNAFKEKDRKDKEAVNVAFVEQKIQEGKLIPAQKDFCLSMLNSFNGADFIINFAESELTAGEVVKQFIDTLPKRVEFGEFATGNEATDLDLNDAEALSKKVSEFVEEKRKAGEPMSYAQALNIIKNKKD